ncbi:ATP-grasp fold amidoligase family protein [Paenibacillus sp. LHD-117]|uniref:ATP-grasp fold amidoligase family protein n=1 Tax=Paenibacillus sp. LHD-117 TaxID=3071412 RepID=UPI0027E1E16B|nr:ATP-grasp fold amidoligase family protein [Paenibacillus sp. LHD-117]MDQ6420681.1 ATP-grasp fold amidoligase family protein [Paenibacillus sp. LHD-117]
MDYKKIIKSQKYRFEILKLLSFIPDNIMIKLQYKIKTGRILNLKAPQRYTEKLQWYKLNYRNSLLTQCADKYTVRAYVKKKGLGHILNELYGVYEKVDDINFDILPNKFVIKVTNSSGTNIFISDKKTMDINLVKSQLNRWMVPQKKSHGREWCYYNIKPRIIIERLIERDSNNDLPDYKFFCFNGRVFCLYTMIEYVDNHENGKLGFYDTRFKKMPYRRMDFGDITEEIPKPRGFEKMVEIAEVLSKDFPHVRVDLYNTDGRIIFGELTFYNASGYTSFYPDEFDYILGNQFEISQKS